MPEHVAAVPRALLGATAVLALLVVAAVPAAATVDDCGGGDIVLLQDADDLTMVAGARITGIGPACDGQPVGVQFLGNDAGDPALPGEELARAYSDEDPCTGADDPSGVLEAGTVEVLLCEGSATAGLVDGRRLTQLRLITTQGTTTVEPEDPPPAGPDVPDPAPDPAADPDPAPDLPDEDLPMTGADILRAALLGAALVVGGTGLVRIGRDRWVRAG